MEGGYFDRPLTSGHYSLSLPGTAGPLAPPDAGKSPGTGRGLLPGPIQLTQEANETCCGTTRSAAEVVNRKEGGYFCQQPTLLEAGGGDKFLRARRLIS